MTKPGQSKLLVLIFVLIPIVYSCAEKKSRIAPESRVKKSAPTMDSSRTPSQTPVKAAILAKKHVNAGQWQKAITIYNAKYREHPRDDVLIRAYVESIENMKSTADRTLDQGDFAAAGREYNIIIRNFKHFKGFEKKLSFSKIHLEERLQHCKKALFKQGFQEYRKENLSGAIALWQDLFDMDPQNSEIKNLLKTAKLQQKNLQEKE